MLVCTAAVAKEYRSADEVSLPPVSQRQIIGTWFDKDTNCTRSFEEVTKKVYYVLRCSDGSGGNSGIELVRMGNKFRSKRGSSHGDYYLVEAGGKLGIYDDQGVIDTLPRHPSLRP